MNKKIHKHILALVLVLMMMISSGIGDMQRVSAAENKNLPYQIMVNRAANCVTVYKKDKLGMYTVPVRSFACSTGLNMGNTPLGTFKTSDYYDWRLMVDGSYGQYAIRFNKSILFHSVPYYSQSQADLESDEFNKLGSAASLGCVRLAVSDVKWLYDNCPQGTTVVVYDDAMNPGPLGKPVQMKVSKSHPFASWDPTDPDPANPWHIIRPSLSLTNDYGDGVLYLPVGSSQEAFKEAFSVTTYNGEVMEADNYSIYVNGNYDLNSFGVYRIWVTGFDCYGISVEKEVILAVYQ